MIASKKALVFALLALLLLGCTQIPSNPSGNNNDTNSPTSNSFELGTAFTITQGVTYSNSAENLTLQVVSFSDSRCPSNVVCIWAGEQGVSLLIKANGAGDINAYLGEVRAGSFSFTAGQSTYTIDLVSVDVNKGQARISITKSNPSTNPGGPSQPPSTESKGWFSIEPKQCNSNAWDELNGNTEEAKIRAWLSAASVEVYDYQSKQVYEVVCESCSCPKGNRVAVSVGSSNSAKMLQLGFTRMDPIACTLDAKVCPDGSAVGREAPFCEFATCPAVEGRQISIVKTDEPGFVINPTTTTTTIDANGLLTVESSTYNRESGTTDTNKKWGYASRQQVNSVADDLVASGFFSITEEDARSCVADVPTVTLEATIGSSSNTLYQIGAECDHNKLAPVKEVLKEIDVLAEASTS